MEDIYKQIKELYNMCNYSQHRNVAVSQEQLYKLLQVMEDMPDTIKMLRETNDIQQQTIKKLQERLDKIKEILNEGDK